MQRDPAAERVTVIANPQAGGGRAGARKAEVERKIRAVFPQAIVAWTQGPGHASLLARESAPQSSLVLSLGGDGTAHEVVNGLFDGDKPLAPGCAFSVLHFGTGGDLVRSLALPRELDAALTAAAFGPERVIDVGHARWDAGREEVFINVAGIGLSADVCRRVERSGKRWGGQVTFLQSILGALATWDPQPMRWAWEGPGGREEQEILTLQAFCASAHYCGAGLYVGKGGSLQDGLFDLTLIPAMSGWTATRLLPKAYAGDFDQVPSILRRKVHTLTLQSAGPLELDGEARAAGPLTLRALPSALSVRGGWAS